MKVTPLLISNFCLLFIMGQAAAQGNLKFEKATYEFGNVTEGTQATYEFRFKNIGDQPVIIANVQPSCGCTTPAWTKTPILPGKSGTVKAVYNSTGRPGAFHKAITVTSNAINSAQVLFIKGTVLDQSAVKPEFTAAQLARSPRLTLTKNSYDFGKLEVGQPAVAHFTIKNTGKQVLTLQDIQAPCNCVNYKISSPEIVPGKEETLELIYNQRVLGEQTEKVSLISNDIVSSAIILTLKAKVVQSLNTTSIIKMGSSTVPFK